MKKCLLVIAVIFSINSFADIGTPITLEKAPIDIHNVASIKRGAKFFATHCMVCHTMKYIGPNKLAANAGITLARMPRQNQKWWADVVPPDLTLITRSRGADWVYTYLHSFYKDPSRPLGSNNLLMNNTNMANVFVAMQGEQILTVNKRKLLNNGFDKKPHYYNVLKRVSKGSMTQEQFDQTIGDLVNFLVYAGEPYEIESHDIGWWVLGFLFLFAIITYLLKREFWKDIEK